MDAKARKILEDAFATCERVDAMLKNMPEREPYDPYVVLRKFTPVEGRERGLDTPPLQEVDKAAADAAWNEWFVQRFTQLFEQHMAEFSDTVVEITFTRMDKHRKELQAEVAALRTELNLLREIRSGHVMELKKGA
jgi:hypothetical protein